MKMSFPGSVYIYGIDLSGFDCLADVDAVIISSTTLGLLRWEVAAELL